MVVFTPLYCPVLPACVPQPITLVTVMPVTPIFAIASFKVRNLSWPVTIVTLVYLVSFAGARSIVAGTTPEISTFSPSPSYEGIEGTKSG